jgi:hypothetical protein
VKTMTGDYRSILSLISGVILLSCSSGQLDSSGQLEIDLGAQSEKARARRARRRDAGPARRADAAVPHADAGAAIDVETGTTTDSGGEGAVLTAWTPYFSHSSSSFPAWAETVRRSSLSERTFADLMAEGDVILTGARLGGGSGQWGQHRFVVRIDDPEQR